VVVQYMALWQQQHPATPLQHFQQLEQQIQQALQQLDNLQAGVQPMPDGCHGSEHCGAAAAAAAVGSIGAGQSATEHYSTALLRRLLDPSWINKVECILGKHVL
jgi:hypothetical protein